MEVDFTHKIGFHGNVPLVIQKNNFRSFIYGQSPTKRANFVKIGPVNVEIIGLTEIIKNNSKNKPSSSE